jgi:hypothetical protein
MEIYNEPKITLFSYVFKQNYNRVWNCLRDVKKTNKICNLISEGYASEVTMSKEKETWELGAEFSLVWKRMIRMYFRTVDFIETPDYSRIRWKVYKTDPPTLDFYLTYCLYQDITGNFSTMVMEWQYLIDFDKTETEVTEKKMENIRIYTAIDKYLTQEENERLQEECIYIESDMLILWKIISNFKIFQRLVPIICMSVSYSGDVAPGTKVTMYFDCKNKAYVHMTIKSIIVRDNLCRLTYECSEGNPSVPKQEIVWTVEEKEGGFCLVSFRHYYEEVLKKESIQQTSKLKKRILQTLKVTLEREFEIESTGENSLKDSLNLGSEYNNESRDN